MRLGRPGVPREGDDGRVDGRERGGVPGSENWEFQRIPAGLTRYIGWTHNIDQLVIRIVFIMDMRVNTLVC
jgi:hypothetical protein